jgi:hypothetical protein
MSLRNVDNTAHFRKVQISKSRINISNESSSKPKVIQPVSVNDKGKVVPALN